MTIIDFWLGIALVVTAIPLFVGIHFLIFALFTKIFEEKGDK